MTVEQVPEWNLEDRMRKALRHAELDTQQMADYLEVSRTSVSNWLNGRNRPSRPALRLWAMRCGVPFGWLIGDTREAAEPGRLVRKSAFPVSVAWAAAA